MAKGLTVEPFTWGAVILAIIGPVLTWLVARRKVSVDESALVLGKWKELVEAHQGQIKSLNEEIATLRDRLAVNEKAFTEYREANDSEKREYRRATEKRIRDLEEENAGLKRAILQNSSSTVIAIGKVAKRDNGQDEAINDAVAKLAGEQK